MTAEEWALMLDRLSVNNDPAIRMREFRKCVTDIMAQTVHFCASFVREYPHKEPDPWSPPHPNFGDTNFDKIATDMLVVGKGPYGEKGGYKRFLLFVGNYGPKFSDEGGWRQFICGFDSREEGKASGEEIIKKTNDWYQLVDTLVGEIVDGRTELRMA